MSEYRTKTLNAGLLQGFIDEKSKAWHYAHKSVSDMIASGNAFVGAVPLDRAEAALDNHAPTANRIKVYSHNTLDENGNEIEVWEDIDHMAIVLPMMPHENRFTIKERLSYIGSADYKIHNPKIACIDYVEAIMDNGGVLHTVVTVGAYAATSWMPAEGRMTIAGFGDVVPFVNASTAANGRLGTSVHTSLVRQVCDNTIRLSAATAKKTYGIKHLDGKKLDAGEARNALDIALAAIDAQVRPMVEATGNITITESDLRAILRIADPLPDDSSGVAYTRAVNRHGEVFTKFVGHDPRITDEMKGTLLGAWQAWNTTKQWSGSKNPVMRNWKHTLTEVNVDDAFWGAVNTLGLANEAVLSLV